MWAGTKTSNISSVISKPIPFSGTIVFGDQSASYAGGLLIAEVHTVNGESETTYYGYSGQYLVKKSMSSSKATIETNYDYASTGNDYILSVETATTTNLDSSGGEASKTITITRHVPIGNGWWGTTVQVDDETVASSMSKGKPGGKASLYCVDESNRSMGSGYSENPGQTLPGLATIDTNFPVSDDSTLIALTAAIEWLNGKTEEHVIMDIFDQPIVDFIKTVTFNRNIYYLEKNTITQDSRGVKQSIDIVRWS
jgi:hypothetical protein